MKRLFLVSLLSGLVVCVPSRSEAQIPILDIINSIVKKVITAIDLEVQRLQTQTIFLQDAQKQVENVMSKLELTQITDWVQKQKDLYAEYYQELWEIKTAISTYEKVRAIIQKQEQIVQDYNHAWSLLKTDPHFNASELSHMYSVYGGMLDQSVKNIGQLTMVVNAFVTQMSDGDRLKLIDGVGASVDQNYSDLHLFTQQNVQTSLERARDGTDASMVKALYGLE